MEVRFRDPALDKLETENRFRDRFSLAIVKAFRRRLQQIRAAPDERDFYGFRSMRFEKLKGKRSHRYSIRLNDQWRLILELDKRSASTVVVVVAIEDYH